MKLRKKIVVLIITLISAALLGLVCLQVYMLNNAYRLELNIFKQNVNAALSAIVQKVETHEALKKVIKVKVGLNQEGSRKMALINMETCDSLVAPGEKKWETNIPKNDPFKIDSGMVKFSLETPQHVRLRIVDSLGQVVQKIIDEEKPAGNYEFAIKDSTLFHGALFFNFKTDSATYIINLEDGRKSAVMPKPASDNRRRKLVERVLWELDGISHVPIEKRIKPAFLDSVVHETLKEKGINTPAAYAVISVKNDSIIMAGQKSFDLELLKSDHKTRIFPYDIFFEKNDLALFFPQQTMYVLRQIGISAVLTFLFILIIILCFIYVIRTIFKQKQFSNLLTDFINNMTHEFKTPISTISLTSETLTNSAVLKNEKRVKKYGKIIQDESARMRLQVEKILQMAALEQGDFELNISDVNIHGLIKNAVDKFVVKIEQREGSIITDLKADNFNIEADKVHLENIIYNLIDNATKYCKEKPVIKIGTKDIGDKIKIAFQDNGIGIKPENQKQVFEKYYRVPTGNIHDVKGFGLGLSYVKLIVEAHQGEIVLASELGKGSTFVIILPLKQRFKN